MQTKEDSYTKLVDQIGNLLESGRRQAYSVVNNILVKTYWEIGKRVVEFEQAGEMKAEYGTKLLDKLAKDLKSKYGKGFSRRNVLDMRRFYLAYPKWQTVSAKLSWSHFVVLLGISDNSARNFYEKLTTNDNLSVRELERQADSMLFERLTLSKNKKEVTKLAKVGHIIEKPDDVIKDPYVFEFLALPERGLYSEKDLEQKLINNLQMFLLELGKGFTFVKRQFRMSLGSSHYFVDLVFYHRILKCFVLIDLKIGKVKHSDIGQMNLYLNYFSKEENLGNDNPPIGIVLTAEKNEIDVEYALGGISNKLFVSKYQLYLPNKEELERKVKEILN